MARMRYELSAQILAEADFSTDKVVCARYNISERTLWRWRALATEDQRLADLVSIKRSEIESEWVSDAIRTIRCQFEFLRRAAEKADPKDPAAIHAIAGAMKLLGDGVAGSRIIDARISGLLNSADGQSNRRPRQALVEPADADEAGDDPTTDSD